MSSGSEEVKIEDSWKIDLEIALLEDADLFRIRSICENRPIPTNCRPDVWRLCLRPDLQQYQTMSTFSEVFDLPNQPVLHSDCVKAASITIDRLSNSTSPYTGSVTPLADSDCESDAGDSTADSPLPSVEQLTSDFESVLTHFAQTYSLTYDPMHGWVSILRLLYEVLRPVNRQELFSSFAAVFHRFVPTSADSAAQLSTLFRILLQYHDPLLSRQLDSFKLHPNSYAVQWMMSLFTNSTLSDENVLLATWDIYFLNANPLFGLFISLVLVLNAKSLMFDQSTADSVSGSMQLKCNREQALQVLLDLPKPMQANDLCSLVELTDLFYNKTPSSFRAQCIDTLFTRRTEQLLSTDGLCLSVSVQDVMESQSAVAKDTTVQSANDVDTPMVRFLVVDCRPADQYNAGHLNTAFFLDSTLMLSDPTKFDDSVSVSALLCSVNNPITIISVPWRETRMRAVALALFVGFARDQNCLHFLRSYADDVTYSDGEPFAANHSRSALLQAQDRALKAGSLAAGEHIALLSSGRVEEDGVTNMVVAAFLRLNTPYVSLIDGGYEALHDFLPPSDARLVHHSPTHCVVCCQHNGKPGSDGQLPKSGTNVRSPADASNLKQTPKAMSGFLSKFSSSLFGSHQPGRPGRSNAPEPVVLPELVPVVKSEAKLQPPAAYRNTSSVFSIDDDMEEDDDEDIHVQHVKHSESSQLDGDQSNRKRAFWPWKLPSVTTSLPPGDSPIRPGGLDSCEPGDLIDTTQWSCRPEVRGVYDCQLINRQGSLTQYGYLVLVERHMLLLVDHSSSGSPFHLMSSLGSAIQSVFSGQPVVSNATPRSSRAKHAIVLRSVPLALITRITANKRIPECITFHYSTQDPSDLLLLNEQVLGIRDRLYIPQAGDAVRMIKSAICTVVLNLT